MNESIKTKGFDLKILKLTIVYCGRPTVTVDFMFNQRLEKEPILSDTIFFENGFKYFMSGVGVHIKGLSHETFGPVF